MADVGLVGFPNAGKSTLISNISKVRSKIAPYPFTTKQPILGFVIGEKLEFVIADLPGIIEGAHAGKGLGDKFLKHAERTKIIALIVDMAGTEGRDPLDDYKQVIKEVGSYSEDLLARVKVIVANKMDLPESKVHLKRFKAKIKKPIFEISALEKKGLEAFVATLEKLLCKENSPEK